ncbi:MAG: hypothetical protein JW828_10840 [Sedimentisphaerales bacterium]|nr:hypothetical protein [Sedimentisphaerales bacterium]
MKPQRSYCMWVFVLAIVICAIVFFTSVLPTLPGHDPHTEAYCSSGMRSLWIAIDLYADSNAGNLPALSQWCTSITNYIIMEDLRCPLDKVGPCSYAINKNLPGTIDEIPEDMVVFFESTPGWNQVGGLELAVTDRHKGLHEKTFHVLFADGTVRWIPAEEISLLRWKINKE